MLRQLYIILLALHPARFRYRFAFQMLAIYDEAAAQSSRLLILADGVRSLILQWVHPYRPPAPATAPAGSGVPLFCSLDTSPPKRWYLMTGATLTLVLFVLLAASIGRGGRSAGALLIGAFHYRPGILSVSQNSLLRAEPTTEIRVRPAPLELKEGPLITSIYPLFNLGVLFFLCDRNNDFTLSPAEIASVPAVLRFLDRNKDGSLSRAETYLDLAVLDTDRNGIISSGEIGMGAAVVRSFDANGDGSLTLKEVLGAVRAGKAPTK